MSRPTQPRSPLRSLLAACALLPGAVLGAPFAYVPNEKSASVSVIDTATDTVVRTLPGGQRPRGIASDGRHLFISEAPADGLVIIDTTATEPTRRIVLGKSPEGIGMSADRRLIAAAVEESNSVVLIDAATRRKLADIKVRGKNPEHAVFSPDGRWLLVSAEEAEQVDLIDVKARRQVAQIPVGKRPRGIGFTPDGRRAYVAC